MRYEILKSFFGSQDGRTSELFEAGNVCEISHYLAQCAPQGSIRPEKFIEIQNKAIISEPHGSKVRLK